MSPSIRRLDLEDPQDQQRLAELKKQPGQTRVYLVDQDDPGPDPAADPPEDILDDKASTKATLDHLARLIDDQRIEVLHCDPSPDRVWVRGRIDGRLRRIGSLPTANYHELISYLKVQAGLDLADDVCQTGAVSWKTGRQVFSGQLQTTPTVNGEKLTFRRQAGDTADNFGSLGFWGRPRRQLEQALGQARGLVLFASPDRAGRQLCLETAEAILLADSRLSLASLADQPTVRHDRQTLVKPRWGRTRQNWLENQVKSDNNALVVDQLTDGPGCQLAVEAALNNKLVLSSLPVDTPDRAVDFLAGLGVDPQLLAASRPTIAAVRPVRKLKPQPKPKRRPSPAEWLASPIWEQFGFDKQKEAVEQLIDQAAQAATEIGGQISKPAKAKPADSDYRGRILLTEVCGPRRLAGLNQNESPPENEDSGPVRDGLIKICLGLTSPTEVELAIAGRRGSNGPA